MFGREENSEKEKTVATIVCLGCNWSADSNKPNPQNITKKISDELKRKADGHSREYMNTPGVVEGDDHRHFRVRIVTQNGAIVASSNYDAKFDSRNPPNSPELN